MLAQKIGTYVELPVVQIVDFGFYLGSEEDKVLLPKKEGSNLSEGEVVSVFLYKDSEDRLIATTQKPKLQVGELALLEVKEATKIGAFLDWGLPKDLLLPYKEQTGKVQAGDQALVVLYVDKTGRLAATMKVYEYLEKDAPYQKDDEVQGIVYEKSDNFGAFVAVDYRYSARIASDSGAGGVDVGDEITARVASVQPDGKLNLSLRKKAYLQMDDDSQMIMARIELFGGSLPFTDKAPAGRIKEEFGLSKNAFKRGVGRLLKEGKIRITETSIEKI